MKIRKIIFFVINKFDRRDYYRFGVDALLRNGFEVEIYDFTPLLRTTDYINTYNPPEEVTDDYVIKIKEEGQLISLLEQETVADVFILSHVTLYRETERIFLLLSKYKLRYAVIRAALPDLRPAYRRIISRIYFLLRYHVFNPQIPAASVVFYAGYNARFQNSSKISSKTLKIEIGSADYNNYQAVKTSGEKLEGPAIIFIDEYYPLHPDLENTRFIDPDYYYQAVNSFLKAYSKKMNMTCGISAHPRADYSLKNPFEFELFYGKTPELVNSAKIVVGHASTAFSYAVLDNKPIIQLGFKQTVNHFYGRVLRSFSRQLGLKTCFLDTDYEMPEPVVNIKKYKRYIFNYVIVDHSIKISDSNESFLNVLHNGSLEKTA